jgi:hypothetical protein
MPKSEDGSEPPPAEESSAEGTPAEGQADERPATGGVSKGATITLVVSLVLVVVLTGVLATLAVLMTRNPDAPPLSQVQVRQLAAPMYFAPVTAVRDAPCPGAEAVLDEASATCYQVGKGVKLTTVRKIEALRESNGTYAVRVVLAPDSREKIADLTRDMVDRQLAIVVGDRVVTAPRVAQEVTQDSLSISGFTKDAADALVTRLLGPGASTQPTTTPQQGTSTQPGVPQTGTTQNGTPQTGATQNGTAQTGTAQTGTTRTAGTQPTSQPVQTRSVRNQPAGTRQTQGGPAQTQGARPQPIQPARNGRDPRFGTCAEAHAAGYGPYTKGRHPEYAWYHDVDHDGVVCEGDELR